MGRGKVQLKRVDNPVYRQITFRKRRAGLFKKANELALLCDADIGVVVFSDQHKLFELATNENMQSLIARYKNNTPRAHGEGENQTQFTEEKTMMLNQENILLQKGLRYMHGGASAQSPNMEFDELQNLERMLEKLIHEIRTKKTQILSQQIKILRNQAGLLQSTNHILQEKVMIANWEFLEPNMVLMTSNFNLSSSLYDL